MGICGACSLRDNRCPRLRRRASAYALRRFGGTSRRAGSVMTPRTTSIVALVWLALLAGAAAYPRAAMDDRDFFETKVRPVLANNCLDCHTDMRSGGLRLDSREAMLKGGRSGPALVPGDPEKSLLIQAVRQTGALKMPKGGKLTAAEIDGARRVGESGAVWPAFAATDPNAASAGKPGAAATLRRLGRPPRWRDCVRHHARAARVLVVPAAARAAAAGRVKERVGARPTSIASCWRASSAKGSKPVGAADKRDADPPRHARSDRPAADAGGNRGVREGHVARRVRQGRRSPAGVAALRRNVGTACGSTSRATAKTTTAASTRSGAASTRIRTRISIATG